MSIYYSVNTSEVSSPVVQEKKEYIYETKEEAKQAFKELLREKVHGSIKLDHLSFDWSSLY